MQHAREIQGLGCGIGMLGCLILLGLPFIVIVFAAIASALGL